MLLIIATCACTTVISSSNPLADNDIRSDIECCCVVSASQIITKTVAIVEPSFAPNAATIIMAASDNDVDGVYDENDQCPNTEAGKKVDQRGCPEILLTLRGVNFNSDSSAVLINSANLLAQAQAAVQNTLGISIIVEGHTDNTADYSYNQLLSERRAKAVIDYLVAHGIEKERLIAVGKGENSPIASNNNKEGRFQNRRVELRTVGIAFIKQEKR